MSAGGRAGDRVWGGGKGSGWLCEGCCESGEGAGAVGGGMLAFEPGNDAQTDSGLTSQLHLGQAVLAA